MAEPQEESRVSTMEEDFARRYYLNEQTRMTLDTGWLRCNLGDLPLRHGDIKPASQALTWIEYLSTLDEYVCYDTLLSPPPTPLPLTLSEEEGTKILPENALPSPVEREEQDTLFLAPHSDTIGLSWVERALSTAALPTRRQDDGVRMDQHPRCS
jgi:hypothetical protein